MDDTKIIKIVEQLIKNLVLIPTGSFLMGSTLEDENAWAEEFPQHLVHVQSFLINKYPITQEQWEAITHLSKVNIELPNYSCWDFNFIGDNLPVVDINWYEALEFCNRLSIFTGLNITLPSEAQWEYACRAETTTRYYWGDNFNPDLANCHKERTTPGGSYPPNPWGLYDMHGNIWEWCLDSWHDNYEGAPTDGSPWLDNNSNTKRVKRGGSCYNYPLICRSTSRFGTANVAGFRICSYI